MLRQIGVTVRNAEREANQERSKQDEQSHDLSLIHISLQDAAYQQMQAEVSQMTASFQLPEAQEQALDE